MRRNLAYPIILTIMLAAAPCAQAWQRVISYGADLSPEDRVTLVRDFGLPPDVSPGQIPTITVQHQEEVALLSKVASPDLIGTRAVSSVYIESLANGSGLQVSVKNITWVTPAMYANAMATAGVRDARVAVTAPAPVSGTAALTGIFKSFSYMTGRTLTPAAEEAAADELVRTGELGQSIGTGKAVEFMETAKEEVARSKASTYEEIRIVVEKVARDKNISLSEDQTRRITDVMIRLSKLGLDPDQLRAQLKNFVQEAPKAATGLNAIIARIIDFLQSLFKQFLGFVGRLLP